MKSGGKGATLCNKANLTSTYFKAMLLTLLSTSLSVHTNNVRNFCFEKYSVRLVVHFSIVLLGHMICPLSAKMLTATDIESSQKEISPPLSLG